MSNVTVSLQRTLSLFIRMKNYRYYSVKKLLYKGKLRGSDENLRSTDSRKSGKRSGFKDKNASSPKTRYESDKIKISKLYASLHNAVIESVLEKSSNAERLFHKHYGNRENFDDIGDIIRKRLEIHPVSHLDRFKKIQQAKSQEQKYVKKRSNKNDKFNNSAQTVSDKNQNENKTSINNVRCNYKDIENSMLQNSKKIISAMANSQSITMTDKLSKSDCLNYFKGNRKYNQNLKAAEIKNPFTNVKSDENAESSIQSDIKNMDSSACPEYLNKFEIHKNFNNGIAEFDANKGFTKNSNNVSIDKEQNYLESSKVYDELIAGEDAFLKNTAYSVNAVPFLESCKHSGHLKDGPEMTQQNDGKSLDFNNNFKKRITDDPIDELSKSKEEKIVKNDQEIFEISIQQASIKNCIENSPEETLDEQNKEKPGDIYSPLNLNHKNQKSKHHLNQNDTENIQEKLKNDNKIIQNTDIKMQEETQSLASKPTTNNDIEEKLEKPIEESSSNSSEHFFDLMEFISGSKKQFSNLKKQLELFGLHEEAKNLEDFSKSINESLKQTILDDMSSYLLGLQNSLLTYCSESFGEQPTGILNITTDNVLSVLDKYLKKPEKSEMNDKFEQISKNNDNDGDSIRNINKNIDDVCNKEEFSDSSEIAEPFKSIVIDKIREFNSIDIEQFYSQPTPTNNAVIEDENVEDTKKIIEADKFGTNITNDCFSNEGNEFVAENHIDLFEVSESGQIVYNNSKEKLKSEFESDLNGLQTFNVDSCSTNIDENLNDELDNFTSDRDKEYFLNSDKIKNNLLSTDQSKVGSFDDECGNEFKGPFNESHKKSLNLDSGKVSKLQNKKQLKAKTFLHPNNWKTHANSYHTSQGIPWVIGKKCSIETIEFDWKSQNCNNKEEIIVSTEQEITMRDSRNGHEGKNLDGDSNMEPSIGNQSIKSFNTTLKTQNSLNHAHEEDKLLNNIEVCKMTGNTSKRNYSTDYVETEPPIVERGKKKLSVRELFPEKKKVQPFSQTNVRGTIDKSIEKESIKLEVIGKKIIPQEVLVETAEEFLPSSSKYEIPLTDNGKSNSSLNLPESDASGSQQINSDSELVLGKDSHEKTEEMILDGFGLSISENIIENLRSPTGTSAPSTLNEDDALEMMQSNPEVESHRASEDDRNETGEYDKGHMGFMQSPQNSHFERNKENLRIFQNTKQPIDENKQL